MKLSLKSLLLASLACAACGSPFTTTSEQVHVSTPPEEEVHCIEHFPAVAGRWIENGITDQYTWSPGKSAHDVCHTWASGTQCPDKQIFTTTCPK